jgi:hypothetical protein
MINKRHCLPSLRALKQLGRKRVKASCEKNEKMMLQRAMTRSREITSRWSRNDQRAAPITRGSARRR